MAPHLLYVQEGFFMEMVGHGGCDRLIPSGV